AHAYPVHGDAVLRHQRGLHARRVAEPDHAPVARAHLGGDCEARHHVPARSARHDHDGARRHATPRADTPFWLRPLACARLTSLREVSLRRADTSFWLRPLACARLTSLREVSLRRNRQLMRYPA